MSVVYEAFVSVGKGRHSEHNRNEFNRYFASRPIRKVDDAVARLAGEIDGTLQLNHPDEIGIGMADATIAAMGILDQEPVLTRNVSDFERVQEHFSGPAIDSY